MTEQIIVKAASPGQKEKEPIEIFELKNTHGCAWRKPGGEIHYGFKGLSSNTQLWLGVAGGYAVQKIINAGLGSIVASEKGAYGGQRRTVSVDVDELENACRLYWERMEATDRSRCHYCGTKATGTGFFGEPACQECGG